MLVGQFFRLKSGAGAAALWLALLTPSVALAPEALAQTGEQRALVSRIERLERDMQDLQRDYYASTGGAAPAGAGPDGGGGNIALRLDSLEQSLRSLTGQVEETSFRLRRIEQQLNIQTGQPAASPSLAPSGAPSGAPLGTPLGTPSNTPSGAPAPLSSAAPQGASGPETASTLPPGTQSLGTLNLGQASDPNAQFELAMDVLYRGDHAGGAQALKSFIEQNPKSERVGEAYYWLGEAELAQKAYREAAEAFLTTVQKYPKDAKAPQSLVKLGVTLIAAGEKKEGCSQLGSVKQIFPKASQSIFDMARRERQKAAC